MMKDKATLAEQALATLRTNDYGDYAVPTKGLYPFQWNWDSATHALGWQAAGEEQRAWREIRTLLASTWDNGLLPHIIFHKQAPTYFPGPGEWGVERTPQTSSISQPPLVGYVARELYSNSKDKPYALEQLRELYPALVRHIRWWFNARWDADLNLVFMVHPWESGRDNSPVYDEPLKTVSAVSREYTRRDTSAVDASERPHKYEYDRYMYLVEFYKRVKFDSDVIRRDSPYKVCDAGINAILARSSAATLQIAEVLGEPVPDDVARRLEELKGGFENLWSDKLQTYCGYDVVAGKFLEVPAVEGFFAMFGKIAPPEKAEKLNAEINRWLNLTEYGIAVVAPDSPLYEPRRYWRGPVWVIVNWLIATGLGEYGYRDTAERLRDSSTRLIDKHGFAEYYDPRDGTPCGGRNFSWPAALALHWLLAE